MQKMAENLVLNNDPALNKNSRYGLQICRMAASSLVELFLLLLEGPSTKVDYIVASTGVVLPSCLNTQ